MENVEAHTTRLLGTVEASTMKSSAVHFQTGDVLYGRLRPYLNKVHLAEFPGLCSAEFIVLTPRNGIDGRFIRYLLNSIRFVSFASALNAGIDRPRVDFEGIADYEFAIPPSSEQCRIVEKVDSLLSKLEAATGGLGRAHVNLKRYRASVLKAAIEGRLVPTEAELAREEGRDFEPASVLLDRILAERRRRWEESELARMSAAGKPPKDDRWKAKYKEPVSAYSSTLPPLPQGWSWVTVDQLVTEPLSNGRSVPTDPNGFPVLRLTALKGNIIDLSQRKGGAWTTAAARPFLVAKGDFLIARGNGSIRLVGWGGLVDHEVDPTVAFPDTLIRVRLAESFFLPELFAHIWNSRLVRDQIERKAKTTAGIHKINQEEILRFVLPLPPLTEQARILSSVESTLTVALATEQAAVANAARCSRLRQTIIKWAFDGKLVSQDPNDEPASVLLERIRIERASAPLRSSKPRKAIDIEAEAAK
jgi:type I restriction enzyme, S subunit